MATGILPQLEAAQRGAQQVPDHLVVDLDKGQGLGTSTRSVGTQHRDTQLGTLCCSGASLSHLKVGQGDFVLHITAAVLDGLEELSQGAGTDAQLTISAQHGVGLPTALEGRRGLTWGLDPSIAVGLAHSPTPLLLPVEP